MNHKWPKEMIIQVAESLRNTPHDFWEDAAKTILTDLFEAGFLTDSYDHCEDCDTYHETYGDCKCNEDDTPALIGADATKLDKAYDEAHKEHLEVARRYYGKYESELLHTRFSETQCDIESSFDGENWFKGTMPIVKHTRPATTIATQHTSDPNICPIHNCKKTWMISSSFCKICEAEKAKTDAALNAKPDPAKTEELDWQMIDLNDLRSKWEAKYGIPNIKVKPITRTMWGLNIAPMPRVTNFFSKLYSADEMEDCKIPLSECHYTIFKPWMAKVWPL